VFGVSMRGQDAILGEEIAGLWRPPDTDFLIAVLHKCTASLMGAAARLLDEVKRRLARAMAATETAGDTEPKEPKTPEPRGEKEETTVLTSAGPTAEASPEAADVEPGLVEPLSVEFFVNGFIRGNGSSLWAARAPALTGAAEIGTTASSWPAECVDSEGQEEAEGEEGQDGIGAVTGFPRPEAPVLRSFCGLCADEPAYGVAAMAGTCVAGCQDGEGQGHAEGQLAEEAASSPPSPKLLVAASLLAYTRKQTPLRARLPIGRRAARACTRPLRRIARLDEGGHAPAGLPSLKLALSLGASTSAASTSSFKRVSREVAAAAAPLAGVGEGVRSSFAPGEALIAGLLLRAVQLERLAAVRTASRCYREHQLGGLAGLQPTKSRRLVAVATWMNTRGKSSGDGKCPLPTSRSPLRSTSGHGDGAFDVQPPLLLLACALGAAIAFFSLIVIVTFRAGVRSPDHACFRLTLWTMTKSMCLSHRYA
jgi:hypothetical protein